MVSIGDHVTVKGEPGQVRFIGNTAFADGEWIGIELEQPVGKNDGSVSGTRYFECQKTGPYGVFVRPAAVNTKADDSVKQVVTILQAKLKDARFQIQRSQAEIERLATQLQEGQSRIEDLEASLESKVVDNAYQEESHQKLQVELAELQEKYDELLADNALLSEELQLSKELEEAVRVQLPESVSLEDFQVLLAHNKSLELALESLRNFSKQEQSKLKTEIASLENTAAEFEILKTTYGNLQSKLSSALATIDNMREELAASALARELVDRLTTENELLDDRVRGLNATVLDLMEIHELDKKLAESHGMERADLQGSILKLRDELEAEQTRYQDLLLKNAEFEAELGSRIRTQREPNDPNMIRNLKRAEAESRAYREEARSMGRLTSELLHGQYEPQLRLLMHTLQVDVTVTALIDSLQNHRLSTSQQDALWAILTAHFRLEDVKLFAERSYKEKMEWSVLTQWVFDLGELVKILWDAFKDMTLESVSTKPIWRVIDLFAMAEMTFGLAELEFYAQRVLAMLGTWPGNDHSELESSASTLENVAREILSQFSEKRLASIPSFAIRDRINDLKKYSNALSLELSVVGEVDSEALSVIAAEYDLSEHLNFTREALSICRKLEVEDWLHPLIYAAMRDTSLVDENLADIVVKQEAIISELRHNIELLENNLSSYVQAKDHNIEELKEQLAELRQQHNDLTTQKKRLEASNQALERQLEQLFSGGFESHVQIPALRSLEDKKERAKEEALADEVRLLKKIVTMRFTDPLAVNQEDLTWLGQPLASPHQNTTSPSKFRQYVTKKRIETTQLAQNIIDTAHFSGNISYKRPSWTYSV